MAAPPSLSKTYSTRANRPNAANSTALLVAQSTLFALKEHMKGTATGGTLSGTRHANSLWATKGSSDGTSFNTSGTDLITSHTNLVWAAGNHSWWWGENTTCGYQVVIDLPSATNTQACIAFAPISTPFTGGSLTARPTSTQEFLWGTGSTGAGTSVVFLSDVVTGNNNYTHYVTADDGQFWFLVSRAGGGLFSTVAGFQKTTGSTDTRAAYVIGTTLNSSRGAMSRAALFDGGTGSMSRCPNGTATHTGGLAPGGFAGGTHYVGNGGPDANTGKYLSGPVDTWNNAAGQYAKRGRVPDLAWVGILPVGDRFLNAGSPERVVVGDCLLPWVGDAPIV